MTISEIEQVVIRGFTELCGSLLLLILAPVKC